MQIPEMINACFINPVLSYVYIISAEFRETAKHEDDLDLDDKW